jgi:hypothetical protein
MVQDLRRSHLHRTSRVGPNRRVRGSYEDTFRAGAGSFVHLPKDIPHAYENVGAGPARFLTLMVPAGVEKFFEEVGKPGDDVSSPPRFEEADIEKLLAVAPKYGAEILTPPEQ